MAKKRRAEEGAVAGEGRLPALFEDKAWRVLNHVILSTRCVPCVHPCVRVLFVCFLAVDTCWHRAIMLIINSSAALNGWKRGGLLKFKVTNTHPLI